MQSTDQKFIIQEIERGNYFWLRNHGLSRMFSANHVLNLCSSQQTNVSQWSNYLPQRAEILTQQ